MSGLQITITTAGKAAIVNAENTGTAPVRIARIGVTAQAFAPNAGMLALPGEIKRLDTFAGEAVADDTLHLTIRDDSADAYSLRGFGLYLADGSLFAVYGQATVILEKSPLAMMLLATDVRFVEITATSLEFGDTTWINPPATVNVPGVVELADSVETTTGTDTTRAVTPAGLKAAIDERFGAGAPTAFVKGLLAIATAAALRTALAIKGAALKDEGEGNGLDADKLDGQHGAYYLDYANLTGKPSTLPPSAHTHQWSDIVNPPATATRWADWGEITGKPVAFVPLAHVHSAADITSGTFAVERIPALPISQTSGLQTALDAKVAKAGDSMSGTLVSGTSSGELRVGGQGAGQVSTVFKFDGTMSIAAAGVPGPFRTIWNSGNFDPATKANLSGAAFTGTVFTFIGAPGNQVQLSGMGWNNGVTRWCWFLEANGSLALHGYNGAGGWTSNPLSFDNATGHVIVNTTLRAPGGQIRAKGGAWGPNNPNNCGYVFEHDPDSGMFSSADGKLTFAVNGSWVLDMSGVNTYTAGSLTSYGGFDFGSSIKLKDIDGPCDYGLAELLQLDVVRGRYKPEFQPDGRDRLFLIAEQLARLIPPAVNEEGVEFNGERVPSIKSEQMLPVLVRSIQQLAAIVSEQADDVAALRVKRSQSRGTTRKRKAGR